VRKIGFNFPHHGQFLPWMQAESPREAFIGRIAGGFIPEG
jgi:hypothetical protein